MNLIISLLVGNIIVLTGSNDEERDGDEPEDGEGPNPVVDAKPPWARGAMVRPAQALVTAPRAYSRPVIL